MNSPLFLYIYPTAELGNQEAKRSYMRNSTIRIIAVCLTLITTAISSLAETPYNEIQLGYGDWAQSWFADDFGDPQYDQPYIVTDIESRQGEYSKRYFEITFGELNFGPAFIIKIGTRGLDRNSISVYDDAIIKIKSANGQISTITAPTNNGAIILVGDNLLKFAELIDQGDFHLALRFHSYLASGNEPVTWTYNCSNETKDFYKAVSSVFDF